MANLNSYTAVVFNKDFSPIKIFHLENFFSIHSRDEYSQGNILFVRTYNTGHGFEITEEDI